MTSDKLDYGATETAVLSGSGFQCGDVLSVLVTAPDGTTRSGDGTGAAGPDHITTDETGGFTLHYHLSGTLADGSTYQGQHGLYRVEVRDSADIVRAATSFSDAGGYHSCVVTAAGGVKCWGGGWYGQLGNGTLNSSAVPVDVSGLTNVVQVVEGYSHTCALTTGGAVKCWGYGEYGQLGNGSFTTYQPTPVDVVGLSSGVARIAASYLHTCAVMTDGSAKCWGYNWYGQLGNNSVNQSYPYGSSTPVDVIGVTNIAQIAAGEVHTCALTHSGSVKCWGYNYDGELGNGTFTQNSPYYGSLTPVDVVGLSNVVQLTAGILHTCALTSAGGAKCWGYNYYGALGNNTFNNSSYPYGSPTPVDVSGLGTGVLQLAAGGYHTCAVLTTGGVKCWGYNYYGELGNNTATTSYPYGSATPVDVVGLTGVTQVSGAFFSTCALTDASGVKCWGFGGDGELGNGTYSQAWTPVDVYNLSSGVAALWDGEGSILSDPDPPTAAPTQAPAANGAGWNNTDVTVTWNWTDTGSGVDAANCTTSSTSSGQGNPLVVSATCRDFAGNTASATYNVKVDNTPPTIVTAATTPPNANGWYKTDVGVAFTCNDSLSGIASCPANQTLTGEGAAVSSSASYATDNAGNSSALSNVVAVSIDRTAPSVAFVGGPANGGSYYFGSVPGAPTCSASDALSDLDGVCAVSGYSAAVGAHTITATAKDKAGNQTTQSRTYTVLAWTFSGFYQPVDMNGVVNTVKNGSTVPIKFKVFAGTTELTDPAIVVQPLTATQTVCTGGATDDIELLATGGTTLRYDTVGGQFIYNWQTPKKAGYCFVVTVTLTDGTSQSAKFQLK